MLTLLKRRRSASDADDRVADDLEHFYDVCLVWASEIQRLALVDGDRGELGDRVF